jgi:phospholipase C
MRKGIPVAAIGIIALLLVSSLGLVQATAPGSPTKLAQFKAHIKHVIFLMQENHAYDSIFGEYCLTRGEYCAYTGDGIPAGTCVPMNPAAPAAGCVKPYNFTVAQESPATDLPHDWNSTHASYNNGSMNNFYGGEMMPGESKHHYNVTFGHYNGTTTPVYWDLAEEYGLGDDFFSSAASYSLPNHWYSVSDTAPNASYLIKTLMAPVNQQHEYLNQSNDTPALEDELLNSTVSWDMFDYHLPAKYSAAASHSPTGVAYDYWNPMASRQQSYTPNAITHFQNRSMLFGDLANGTLPNISWVIPLAENSDHPIYNISSGQNWVASLVDALEKSPEWNSTVLFVTWDEYGGFYDHVAPPRLDANGTGFRVPLLAISPWVMQGAIDHAQMNFDSIVHLMEDTFGLKCMGARDCRADLPLSMFNFNRGPRAPMFIPPYARAVYPMPLQSSGKLPRYGPTVGAPIYWTDPPQGPLPADIDWS